jgi:hypothetical protein
MQQKFDVHRAPQTPLRAERNPGNATVTQDAGGHIRGVEASPGGLIRSTLIAGGAAVAVLAVFYLPSEYGIDPTGLGGVLGLTEMGQIKQQLYAEAEADAAGLGATATLDPEVMARLDRIELQLAAIGAVIGAPAAEAPTAEAAVGAASEAGALTVPAPVAEPVAEPAPEPVLEPAPDTTPETAAEPAPDVGTSTSEPAIEAAVAEATTSDWRDEVSYTLAPGEGIEVKLVMEEGQTARFEWTANGSVVNYDTHGDGSGQKISYETGRGVPEQAGDLTAAFTGNHGWFWRNRTEEPVTVTVRTAGDYAEMKLP